MGFTFRLGRPTEKARNLRNNATEAERQLWQRLKGSQLANLKFSRQLPIAGFVCDFVCRAKKLVVEIDGSQHSDAMDYDAARTARIEAQGYRVIRFWNNDLTNNLDGVLETIVRAAFDGEVEPTPQPPPASGRGSF